MKTPDGWTRVKLKDVAESINAGGTPRRGVKDYWENGDVPWLKISDLKSVYISESQEKITKKGLENSSAKLFPKGTVLFSIFATLGAVGILKAPSTTNQAIAGITPNKRLIDTKYLYYSLKAEKKNIIAKKTHATQDNINLTVLRNHEILLPPLNVQKEIVSILDKAEKLEQWRRESDKLADDYLNSVFFEMFGDPITNPKNLEIKKLKEVANITMGQSPKGDSYNKEGIGMPLLNGPTEFGVKYPIEKQWTSKPTKLAKRGSILFCVRGATAGRMNWADKEYCIGRGLASIDSKGIVSNEYLYEVLKGRYSYFQNIGQGSTFINISKNILSSLLIPIPENKMIEKFVGKARAIEELKEQQRKSKYHIDNLFNVLMRKAFRGELVR